MITWLFGLSIVYDVITILAIGFLLFLCIKVPESRKIILSLLVVIYIGITCYCGYQLNAYYTVEGGIYGKLSSIIKNQEKEKFEEIEYGFKYNVKNINLNKEDDNTFSATILFDKINLKQNVDYAIFINDIQCYDAEVNSKYILADYTYKFMNDKLSEIITDTLNITIAMNDYNTTLKLTTHGGQAAADYWYGYNSKNDFIIEIKEAEFVKENKFNVFDNSNANTILPGEYTITDSFEYEGDTYATALIERKSVKLSALIKRDKNNNVTPLSWDFASPKSTVKIENNYIYGTNSEGNTCLLVKGKSYISEYEKIVEIDLKTGNVKEFKCIDDYVIPDEKLKWEDKSVLFDGLCFRAYEPNDNTYRTKYICRYLNGRFVHIADYVLGSVDLFEYSKDILVVKESGDYEYVNVNTGKSCKLSTNGFDINNIKPNTNSSYIITLNNDLQYILDIQEMTIKQLV